MSDKAAEKAAKQAAAEAARAKARAFLNATGQSELITRGQGLPAQPTHSAARGRDNTLELLRQRAGAASQPRPGTGRSMAGAASKWIKTLDPASGVPYWCCPSTKETSWLSPSARDVPDPTKVEWAPVYDETTAALYWWHVPSGSVSWEKPAGVNLQDLSWALTR